MAPDRRQILRGMGVAAGAAVAGSVASSAQAAPPATATGLTRIPQKPYRPPLGPRSRVIHVNDLANDSDGVFALAHAAMAVSAQLVSVVATIGGIPGEDSADLAKQRADATLKAMKIKGVPTFAGSNVPMSSISAAAPSAGARAIVAEANRTDTSLPLYVTVGGGLTEVASALLLDPSIASKFTLVWIGGAEYPNGGKGETNFGIDPTAAQFVFNRSMVPIWHIDRGAYSTCLISDHQLQLGLLACGAVGTYLWDALFVDWIGKLASRYRLNRGESYSLGDNPLVLLTAIGNGLSKFEVVPAPTLNEDGTYTANPNGRQIRHYTQLDVRLMFDDLFAKLILNYGKLPH